MIIQEQVDVLDQDYADTVLWVDLPLPEEHVDALTFLNARRDPPNTSYRIIYGNHVDYAQAYELPVVTEVRLK